MTTTRDGETICAVATGANEVLLAPVGPKGGLRRPYYLAPDEADELAGALTKAAAEARAKGVSA